MVDFFIKALATWRVAHMITEEYGPYGIFKNIRELFGVDHDWNDKVIAYPTNSPIICLWCVSVWVGIAFTVLPSWAAKPFAYGAASILLNESYWRLNKLEPEER